MERKEAVALLKEMSAEKLAEFSWVVLQEKEVGEFQLQISKDQNFEVLEKFMDENDLEFEEEPINSFIIIHKR